MGIELPSLGHDGSVLKWNFENGWIMRRKPRTSRIYFSNRFLTQYFIGRLWPSRWVSPVHSRFSIRPIRRSPAYVLRAKTAGLCGDFFLLYGCNESDFTRIPALRGFMSKPEEDELSEEKRKKEGYSIIVALIAVLIIGISFIWHLWSALMPAPPP